ncbi:MAG: adenylosuccinate synthetase [Pirellulales bacterium]
MFSYAVVDRSSLRACCCREEYVSSRIGIPIRLHADKNVGVANGHCAECVAQRRALQELGEKLDVETNGSWVRDALSQKVRVLPANARIVIDSVRIQSQMDSLRGAYGARVVHIHLDAPESELTDRYSRRKRADIKELTSYAAVQESETERAIGSLAATADVVIDTVRCTEEDVLIRAASHLGIFGRGYDRVVDVLVGGEYGSEGKGQIAAYLAPEYDLLVRVGGPNAGHTVYEEPTSHTFRHLPSGTRSSSAQIVIGPGAVVHVPTLLDEIAASEVAVDRLSIDPQVITITDEDIATEVALTGSIGSTGKGVGVATARRILDRGIRSVETTKDAQPLRPFVRDTARIIEDACCRKARILLEGTQGTGLSLIHGPYPHVTSRDTTVAGCLAEAGISPSRVRKVIMVCRTYPIRVANPKEKGKTSGPFSREIDWTTIAERSGLDVLELRKAEHSSVSRKLRRVGEFDWALLKKASFLNAPTDIAMTFVDYICKSNRDARRFEQLTPETVRFLQEVERVAHAPVTLISTRFHSRAIIDRRAW